MLLLVLPKIDDALIAGIRMQSADHQWEYSIRKQLAAIENSIRAGSIEYIRIIMDIKTTDLVSLFENALKGLSDEKLEEIGLVIKVGDNICFVHGLKKAMYGEFIEFEGGNSGIIFNLDEDSVAIFLLDISIPVAELEVAKRTDDVFQVPVGNAMLGRVLNALGKPIDALGDIKAD